MYQPQSSPSRADLSSGAVQPDSAQKRTTETVVNDVKTLSSLIAACEQVSNRAASGSQNISVDGANRDGGQRTTALKLTAEETLSCVNDSADILLSVSTLVRDLNSTCTVHEGRAEEIAKEILPIVVKSVTERAFPPRQPAEERLSGVFDRFNPDGAVVPPWFKSISGIVDVVGNQKHLPEASLYLEHSPRAYPVCTGLILRLKSLKGDFEAAEKLQKLDEKNDKLIAEAEAQGQEVDRKLLVETGRDWKEEKIVARLEDVLAKIKDVNPASVPRVRGAVSLEVVPSVGYIGALIDCRKSLGEAIVELAKNGARTQEPFAVEVALFETEQQGEATGIKNVDTAAISLEALFAVKSDEELNGVLGSLLRSYNKVHSALEITYEALTNCAVPPQYSAHHEIRRAIEQKMDSLLPGGSNLSRETLVTLTRLDDPSIQTELSILLASNVVTKTATQSGLSSPLLQNENVELLGRVVALGIKGDGRFLETFFERGPSAALDSIRDFTNRIRTAVSKRDFPVLINEFVEAIDRLSADPRGSRVEKLVALQTLVAIADDTAVRACLKGKLPNLDKVDALARSLQDGMLSNDSPHTRFVEKLRAEANRTFSFTLSDYWGQRELVKDWKKLLTTHLELLKKPDAWQEIPPDQLFMNGYLLYGAPGAGKSFLVQCMANEFMLPLLAISREEMMREVHGKAKSSELGAGDLFAGFLEKKIDEARGAKKKSGASAAIIFLDELEAEFLRRDPLTGARDEIDRTNVMLRVVEKLIKKNPDIIFVGATNFIELVDDAAHRTGRFGVHLETKLPGEDDIKDILTGSLLRLGISVDEEFLKSTSGETLTAAFSQMTPLEIQICLNQGVALKRLASKEPVVKADEGLISSAVEVAALLRSKKWTRRERAQKQSSINP